MKIKSIDFKTIRMSKNKKHLSKEKSKYPQESFENILKKEIQKRKG